MSRKDPKIIRVGDMVKVINPQLFIRCGYPMSFKDSVEEVKKEHGDKIRNFMLNIEGITRNNSPLFAKYTLKERITDENKTFLKIVNALAYDHIRRKGFGGRVRQIFTKEDTRWQDEELLVDNIKFVKTGVYVKGGTYYTYDEPYPEYEPSCLDDEATHKILGLSRVTNRQYSNWVRKKGVLKVYPENKDYWWDIEIEADNVVKLFQEEI